MPHIVDVLIEERAPNLMRRPTIWRLVQNHVFPLLGYQDAIDIVDHVQGMTGYGIFDHVSDRLRLDLDVRGIDSVPREGAAILMPNHPAGIADGIAVYDAVREIRPDVCFFANRDAVRCAPSLTDLIIPVEWAEDKRTHTKSKETVREMLRAFKDGRLVVIFASGRLARPTPWGLMERPWLNTGVSLAQKYDCPIVPLHITAYNSALYYLLWFLNTELRDMTLFRELLNKNDSSYRLQFGEPMHPQGDPDELTLALRRFVTRELRRGNRVFA